MYIYIYLFFHYLMSYIRVLHNQHANQIFLEAYIPKRGFASENWHYYQNKETI